ncbi:MAG: DUF5069 domain-containing protein [Verrucomicrobiota bacterium]|nr:DUF5069 domain-containing protein [Verrucomicrobiota bacterium]
MKEAKDFNVEGVRKLARNLEREEPRSSEEKLGGFRIAARTLDKCRATLVQQQGDYMFGCPMDRQFFRESGINQQEFENLVATGASDEEVSKWIEEHAASRRQPRGSEKQPEVGLKEDYSILDRQRN